MNKLIIFFAKCFTVFVFVVTASQTVEPAVIITPDSYTANTRKSQDGNDGKLHLTSSSEEAKILCEQAVNLKLNNQPGKAKDLLEKALNLDPDFAMAHLHLRDFESDPNKSKEHLDKAIALSSKVTEGEREWIKVQQLAVYSGNTPELREQLNKTVKLLANDKMIQFDAGNMFSGMDIKSAVQCLNRALEIDRKFAEAYNSLGYLYMREKDYPKAEKAFRQYIKLQPDNPNSYDSYAELLLNEGHYDQSIAYYEKALQKDPKFYSSVSGLGNNYAFKGNYEKAISLYEKQLNEDPDPWSKISALNNKAAVLILEGKVSDAAKTLEDRKQIAEKSNIPAQIFWTDWDISRLFIETGTPDEGYKYLQKAKETIKNTPVKDNERHLMDFYFNMLNARYYTVMNDLPSAHNELEKCRQFAEKSGDYSIERLYNLSIGMIMNKEGKYDDALSYLDKGISDSPTTWFYMAKTYQAKGNMTNKEKYLDKIRKSNQINISLAIYRSKITETMSKK